MDKEKSLPLRLIRSVSKKTMSMARTTGYTCTAVTNLVLNGTYNRIGISPRIFRCSQRICFRIPCRTWRKL